MEEMLESALSSKGDLAGVFEYDGETGYFYLYDVIAEEKHRIVDAIQILTGSTDLNEPDVTVRWDDEGRRVGLFLRGVQWATFDTTLRKKFGGNYIITGVPNIPKEELI